jgi:hypothetical protein
MRYWPFDYSRKCKRNLDAGLPFFYDNLGDDLLIVLMAFALVSDAPMWVALGVTLLHFSLWIIYEIGYFENDRVSVSLEADGKTPANFEKFRHVFSQKNAWAWAIVIGLAGVAIVMMTPVSYFAGTGITGFLIAAVLWISFLGALRCVYYAFNHVDKMSRIYLYLPLQLLKYAFPALFFTLSPAGAALVFAQVIRRWVPYIVYRHAHKMPEYMPARLLRIIVFTSLWLLLLPSNLTKEHLFLGAAAGFVLLLRSTSQIRGQLRKSKGIRKDNWQSDAK